MKHQMEHRIKHLVTVAIITSLLCFVIIWFISSKFIKIDLLDRLSYAVTLSTFFTAFYERFLWKYFTFCNKIPKIFGEYKVKIDYSYQDQCGTKMIDATIKQTYLTTKVFLTTDEITSITLTSDIVKDNDEMILYYTYRTTPKMKFSKENPINLGATRLVIKEDVLEGIYWTARNTVGDINMKKKR